MSVLFKRNEINIIGGKEGTAMADRRLVQDTVKYLLAYLIPAVVGLVALTFYTRLLTPDEYGNYVIVIITASLVSVTCLQWLWVSAYRYYQRYAQKEESFQEFLATLFLTFLLLAGVLLALWSGAVVALSRWIGPQRAHLFLLGGFLLVAQSMLSLVLHLLRASFQSLRYSVYASLKAVGTVTLALFFIWKLKLGPAGILWGSILATSAVALWEFNRWIRHINIKRWRLSWKTLCQFLRYGFPLTGTYLADFILAASDRYMIGYFIGTMAVGVYSAGYNLTSNILSNAFLVFGMAVHPFMVAAFEKTDTREVQRLMRNTASVYVILIIPMVLGISYLAKPISQAFFGVKFHQAYQFIPWVAVGTLCLGFTKHYINWIFQLKERTSFILYIFAVSAIFNVVLNLFWIPRFGALGAAYSTMLSYLLILILSIVLARRLIPIPWPWWSMGKSLVASLAMILVLSRFSGWPSNIPFIFARVGIGIGIYFITLLIFQEEILTRLLKSETIYILKLVKNVLLGGR
jgi:O-antigen/teichoic acid export membrane protein